MFGGSALAAACGSFASPIPTTNPTGPTAASRTSRDVRAVAFDLFTLFDPRGVDERVNEVLPQAPGFAAAWKTRLFEYSWLRAASGHYADFTQLVSDALTHVSRAQNVALTADVRSRLEAAFTELALWPDSLEVLSELRGRGLRLAPLANFSPQMIEELLTRRGVRDQFEVLISTDRARTYKPDPRAYALGERVFGLERRQIAFAAFGGWDAAGARWYGYPTFWVNRFAAAPEELIAPDATGPDLERLAAWLPMRPLASVRPRCSATTERETARPTRRPRSA